MPPGTGPGCSPWPGSTRRLTAGRAPGRPWAARRPWLDGGMPDYDAFLLVSFGGPEGPGDVMPFLENVTRGRAVPPDRLADEAHHYELFTGATPINKQCRDPLTAIAKTFATAMPDL